MKWPQWGHRPFSYWPTPNDHWAMCSTITHQISIQYFKKDNFGHTFNFVKKRSKFLAFTFYHFLYLYMGCFISRRLWSRPLSPLNKNFIHLQQSQIKKVRNKWTALVNNIVWSFVLVMNLPCPLLHIQI